MAPLKIFFVTQGSSLSVFYRLLCAMKEQGDVEESGWFVADRRFYDGFFLKNHQGLGGDIIKEWEVFSSALSKTDLAGETAEWEKKFGVNTLWPAAVSDRRVFEGRLSKVVQDYASPYTREQMLSILVSLSRSFYSTFSTDRPDVVISFGPNTAGARIAGMAAKSLGIPMLTLKSTKIANYVTLGPADNGTCPDIEARFKSIRSGVLPSVETLSFAKEYIQEFKHAGAVTYEGANPFEKKLFYKSVLSYLRIFPGAWRQDRIQALNGFDPQYVPAVPAAWHQTLGRALRQRAAKRAISTRYFTLSQAQQEDYIFFPLNSEPEIAVSVYTPYFRNQIEAARNIAQALPASMKLVIKDHPRSWGLRPAGYYRRLLEIPNVYLAEVETPVAAYIKPSRAVAILSSFAGFEAILQGKKVISFGNNLFDCLGKNHIRKVEDLNRLPELVQWALEETQTDEKFLEDFIVAVVESAVPIDLYGRMLQKSGRSAGTLAVESDTASQYKKFASYVWHVCSQFSNQHKAVINA